MAKRTTGGPEGILLIDKPQGWTSHDVVAKARGICRQRRIGHTGTLDPMATGLLVLCLGRATRLVEYMTAHDKEYVGEMLLGAETDTDDADGTVTARFEVPPLTGDGLDAIAAQFTGVLQQVPPAYSAVKVDGQRAYAVARKGGEPELKPRPVRIDELELRHLGGGRLAFRVACGAGTYVRSLARDIGRHLGCGAHLTALRRTRAGAFDVAEAVTLEALQGAADAGKLEELLRAPDEGVGGLPAAILGQERAASWLHGTPVRVEPPAASFGAVRAYDTKGYFLGIGSLGITGELKGAKVFARESGELDVMSRPDTKVN